MTSTETGHRSLLGRTSTSSLSRRPEPPHVMDAVLARRFSSDLSPKAEATSGRTVTNRTKLAAAITATRMRCCQVLMPTSLSLVPALVRVDLGEKTTLCAHRLLVTLHYGRCVRVRVAQALARPPLGSLGSRRDRPKSRHPQWSTACSHLGAVPAAPAAEARAERRHREHGRSDDESGHSSASSPRRVEPPLHPPPSHPYATRVGGIRTARGAHPERFGASRAGGARGSQVLDVDSPCH